MIRAAAIALAAQPAVADPGAALKAFATHCFSPFLTAAKAADAFDGLRHDFYDLKPFSAARPSLPRGPVTPGTDRRCEVAFDGAHLPRAIEAAKRALAAEGIREPAGIPDAYPRTAPFAAARRLNPNRIAVVLAGTREGPNGTETFLAVERLEPSE